MKPQIVLLTMLVLATAAAAQPPGPDPGSPDVPSYAVKYAEQQAAEIQADPAAYAVSKGNSDNLQADVSHAAWMACWAADDAQIPDRSGLCERYYTSPRSVEPEPEVQGKKPISAANRTVGRVNETVQENIDDVQDALPPLPADSFLDEVIEGVQGAVSGLFEAVQDFLGGSRDAIINWAEASTGMLDGFVAMSTEGMVGTAKTFHGAGVATAELGDDAAAGIADASRALGDSVRDAADAIGATLTSWFQSSGASEQAGLDAPDDAGDVAGGTTDGLLETVGNLSPM